MAPRSRDINSPRSAATNALRSRLRRQTIGAGVVKGPGEEEGDPGEMLGPADGLGAAGVAAGGVVVVGMLAGAVVAKGVAAAVPGVDSLVSGIVLAIGVGARPATGELAAGLPPIVQEQVATSIRSPKAIKVRIAQPLGRPL